MWKHYVALGKLLDHTQQHNTIKVSLQHPDLLSSTSVNSLHLSRLEKVTAS